MKDNFLSFIFVLIALALIYVMFSDMQRDNAVLYRLSTTAPAGDCTFFPGDKVEIITRGWRGKVDNATFGQDSIGVDYTDYEDKKQHGWFKSTDLQLIDTPTGRLRAKRLAEGWREIPVPTHDEPDAKMLVPPDWKPRR